jgi:hypothetical protein
MPDHVTVEAPTDMLLSRTLEEQGFVRLSAGELLDHLGPDARAGWPSFAKSWDDLGPDRYMADGGRYRRRRHAALRVAGSRVGVKPRQPHYQSRDYNPLNGDVERWFEPVDPATLASPVIISILALCGPSFGRVGKRPEEQAWHVEIHQFRIETSLAEPGRPTPEGMHRDGVDWVFVMLVDRQNVREGVTRIGAIDGTPLGEFILTAPGDSVLLDDHRIVHGVTPIRAVDPDRPAWRDALVVTWTAEDR